MASSLNSEFAVRGVMFNDKIFASFSMIKCSNFASIGSCEKNFSYLKKYARIANFSDSETSLIS
jgi:hypothetical protein